MKRRVDARGWWRRATGSKEWTKADRVAVADRETRQEGRGRWTRQKRARTSVHMRRESHASQGIRCWIDNGQTLAICIKIDIEIYNELF